MFPSDHSIKPAVTITITMLNRWVVFLCFCFLCLIASRSFAAVVLMGNNLTLSFQDIEANFAPPVKGSGEGGTLFLAEPLDACAPLANKSIDESVNQPFVLIIRGICSFEEKIRRAQSAGFKAAIIYNYDDTDLVAMAGVSTGIKIHAVFIKKSAGLKLSKYVGIPAMELWIIPTYVNSAWSIMAISFISLLAMSAVLATCFFVRRHRIRRGRPQASRVREFHGMSSRLVKAMPSLIFTAVLEDNCTSATCAICLEDYNVGDKLRILPCRHNLPFYSVQTMETLAQNYRLDAHDKQIQQLQSDVSEIKTTIKALEVDRGESREFRKEVLNWIKQHEQKTVAGSLDSGANSGVAFLYSRPKSVSDRDFSPKSASDRDLSGGLPSLVAQLEALVSRSEERLHFGGLTIHNPEGQLDGVIKFPNLDLFEKKVSCHDSGVDISNLRLAITTPISGFTKSENPVDNLQSDVFASSLNPYASFTSFDSDLNQILVPQVHPSHSKICSNLFLKIFEWKPGLDSGGIEDTKSRSQLIDLQYSSTEKDSNSEPSTIILGAFITKSTDPIEAELPGVNFDYVTALVLLPTPYLNRFSSAFDPIHMVLLEFGTSVLVHQGISAPELFFMDANPKPPDSYTNLKLDLVQVDKWDIKKVMTTKASSQHLAIGDELIMTATYIHTLRVFRSYRVMRSSSKNKKLLVQNIPTMDQLLAVRTFFPTKTLGILWGYRTASTVIELTMGPYHLWLVNGQGRPPENALGEVSAWLTSPLLVPSLEDKTVSKGGVMIGIILVL